MDFTQFAQPAADLAINWMNVANQNQRLDRQEAQTWDMYQQQREDANTAHQREVADLKAAGLNPILTLGAKGAPVATGAAGSGSAASMSSVNLLNGVRQRQEIENLKSQKELTDAQKQKTDTETSILGKEKEKASFFEGLWKALNFQGQNAPSERLKKRLNQILPMELSHPQKPLKRQNDGTWR